MKITSIEALRNLDFTANPDVLSPEEGYVLTEKYVTYLYWHNENFSFLRSVKSVEDVIGDVYLHFLEKDLFKKYNFKITTKKYHVMLSCKRHMIDMSRKLGKLGNVASLDAPVVISAGDDVSLHEVLPDPECVEEVAYGAITRDNIIARLPNDTTSKVIVDSPIHGKVKYTLREIALLLEAGFDEHQIARTCYNPSSND